MFKNVFKSLNVFKSGKSAEKTETGAADGSPDQDAEFKPQRISRLIDIIQPTAMTGPTPEEICGVTKEMSGDQIRERLALLYRRYNRAASSLDPKLRNEAERMLDAIVTARENAFGPI